jgi:hypothetical protein
MLLICRFWEAAKPFSVYDIRILLEKKLKLESG